MKNVFLIIIALLYAYPFGFVLGSLLLRRILAFVDPSNTSRMGGHGLNPRNEGFWIGMCEHFIIVTFILMNQFTALGILFAARGLVRTQDIKENASYYLLGMLLNLCFASFFGITTKLFLNV